MIITKESGLPLKNIDLDVVPKYKRNMALDVFRGVAILMVMFNHNPIIDKQFVPTLSGKCFRFFFSVIQTGGWSGVDLFFVLSGFLISGLLYNEFIKTGSIQPVKFLIRRGFKLYPSLLFFIAITFLVEYVFDLKSDTTDYKPIDYLKDLAFLHNYLGGRWDITWSLDVEEIFYILLTVYFIFVFKMKDLSWTFLAKTYTLLVLMGIFLRIYANLSHPAYDFNLHYSQSHFRLDGLFFGVLLSYFYTFKKSEFKSFFHKYKIQILVLSLIFIFPNFAFHKKDHNWISVILLATNPVAYGSLMIIALESKNIIFRNKILSIIGKNSYSIYLWHVFILGYLSKYFHTLTSITEFSTFIILYLSISIAYGIVITKLIEDPFLKLRDKLYPPKSKSPVIS